jgi:hypothetical protein
MGFEHHIYDAITGNMMKRFAQYLKDQPEVFADYFQYSKERCRPEYVNGWPGHTLSFDFSKRRKALDRSPIPQLSQITQGQKDPPQVNRTDSRWRTHK